MQFSSSMTQRGVFVLVLKRLWHLVKEMLLLYILSIAATAFAACFSLLIPQVVKYAIDTVINGEPSPYSFGNVGLFGCAVFVFAFSIGQGVFTFFKGKWSAVATEKIIMDVKNRLYSHIQKLPYAYHVKAQTGDLIQRATSDVETIRRFLETQIMELGRIIFIVAFTLYFMFNINVRLALLSLCVIPAIIIFSVYFSFKISKAFLQADEKEGELATVLNENLSAVRVVRAFGREQFEIDKFEEKNSGFRNLAYKMIKKIAVFWAVSDFFCLIQIGIVLLFGLQMVFDSQISLGTFILFNAYVSMLIWPVRSLGRILSDMSKMGVSLNRIMEILNEVPEQDEFGHLHPGLDGDVVFDNVCFSYGDSENILNNLSFTVKAGETIGVLGGTGSGKSTIMHLLIRLYDLKSGKITINGMDINHIEKKWLRQKIGLVLQEPFLYSKTIKENIKMANNHVLENEIEYATKTAAIHEDVLSFESGYETLVGERGVTLSGGQKQRLAIARTIIKNSDILVFDDSLSAVDTETDKQIRQALSERRKDVTTFIISQRMTTLMDASRIFIIENGEIADSGTHEELISRPGLYSRIWEIQNMQDF